MKQDSDRNCLKKPLKSLKFCFKLGEKSCLGKAKRGRPAQGKEGQGSVKQGIIRQGGAGQGGGRQEGAGQRKAMWAGKRKARRVRAAHCKVG